MNTVRSTSGRPFKFFYHYNKPMSQKEGVPIISLHCLGACHMVRSIKLMVPTQSRIRKTQPHLVIVGEAGSVEFDEDGAIVRSTSGQD